MLYIHCAWQEGIARNTHARKSLPQMQGNPRHTGVCLLSFQESCRRGGRSLAGHVGQPVRHRPRGNLRARPKPQLVENVLDVVAGGALGDG